MQPPQLPQQQRLTIDDILGKIRLYVNDKIIDYCLERDYRHYANYCVQVYAAINPNAIIEEHDDDNELLNPRDDDNNTAQGDEAAAEQQRLAEFYDPPAPNPTDVEYYKYLLGQILCQPLSNPKTKLKQYKPNLYFIDYLLRHANSLGMLRLSKFIGRYIIQAISTSYFNTLKNNLLASVAQTLGQTTDLKGFEEVLRSFNSTFKRWAESQPFHPDVMHAINDVVSRLYQQYEQKVNKQAEYISTAGISINSHNAVPGYHTTTTTTPTMSVEQQNQLYQQYAMQMGAWNFSASNQQQQQQQQQMGSTDMSMSGITTVGGAQKRPRGYYEDGVDYGSMFTNGIGDNTTNNINDNNNNNNSNSNVSGLLSNTSSNGPLFDEPLYSTNNLRLDKPSVYHEISTFPHMCSLCGIVFQNSVDYGSHAEYHAYMTKLKNSALEQQQQRFGGAIQAMLAATLPQGAGLLTAQAPKFDYDRLFKVRQYYLSAEDWILYRTTHTMRNIYEADILDVLRQKTSKKNNNKNTANTMQSQRNNNNNRQQTSSVYDALSDEEGDDMDDDDYDDIGPRDEQDILLDKLKSIIHTIPLAYDHLHLNPQQRRVNEQQLTVVQRLLAPDDEENGQNNNNLGNPNNNEQDNTEQIFKEQHVDISKLPAVSYREARCSLAPHEIIPYLQSHDKKTVDKQHCAMCSQQFQKSYSPAADTWVFLDCIWLSSGTLQKQFQKFNIPLSALHSFPQYTRYRDHLIHFSCFKTILANCKQYK